MKAVEVVLSTNINGRLVRHSRSQRMALPKPKEVAIDGKTLLRALADSTIVPTQPRHEYHFDDGHQHALLPNQPHVASS